VEAFWDVADETQPEAMLQSMRRLVEERGEDDPDALYEWASVHDFLGRETDAIPLYRTALDHGLASPRLQQAVIQLASSLRNIGHADEAAEILMKAHSDDVVGDAAQAFLALALHDCGRYDEALRVALRALARTLPFYGRSITAYADELGTAGQ
jgi:tetratricopeptide (TPR) repeat protein